MPDTNIADGSTLNSSTWNSMVREQVTVTCTSGTRPSGTDGRFIYETDTEKLYVYENSTWNLAGGARWVSYTPSWTNLTIGNGSQTAVYRYVQGGMWVHGAMTFGTTTAVTGSITQTVPNSETIRALSTTTGTILGEVLLQDTGTASYHATVQKASGTTVTFFITNVSGTYATFTATSSTVPFTWTTNDVITWSYFAPI